MKERVSFADDILARFPKDTKLREYFIEFQLEFRFHQRFHELSKALKFPSLSFAQTTCNKLN